MPNWVEFTWDKPQTIAAARIVSGFHAKGGITAPVWDFSLQYEAGGKWKDIPGTATKANPFVDWFHHFRPIQATKVRLHVTDASIKVSRLWEVALYAPAETGKTEK